MTLGSRVRGVRPEQRPQAARIVIWATLTAADCAIVPRLVVSQ